MIQTQGTATLAAARSLAAAGDYAAATALLDGLGTGDHLIEARLLRAKMLAQQARFGEAIAEWNQVLASQPDHQEAKEGVALAERMKSSGSGAFRLRARLYAGSLLLLLAAAVVVGPLMFRSKAPATVASSSPAPTNNGTLPTVVSSPPESKSTEDLATGLAEARREIEQLKQWNISLAAVIGQETNISRSTETRLASDFAERIAGARRDIDQLSRLNQSFAAITNTLVLLQKETSAQLDARRQDINQLNQRNAQTERQVTELAAQLESLKKTSTQAQADDRRAMTTMLESLISANKEMLTMRLEPLEAERRYWLAMQRTYAAEAARPFNRSRSQQIRAALERIARDTEALRAKNAALSRPAEQALELLRQEENSSSPKP